MNLSNFLDLMNADLRNEWTHLQFYLYHASAITGFHALEFKEFFTDAAAGEMKHVQAFLDRLYGLNYPTPNQSGLQFPVFTTVEGALAHAIKIEEEVVTNYALRLKQLEDVAKVFQKEAAYLTVFYEDQLQDSYEDAERMKRIVHQTASSVLERAGFTARTQPDAGRWA